MGQNPTKAFNPYDLEGEDQQIPAKIWELLRRNVDFRKVVHQLRDLDDKESKFARTYNETGQRNYHGPAWEKSYELVKRVRGHHPFAGVALQWLVPEPLFRQDVVAWPRGAERKSGVPLQVVRSGEGLTPNVKDKSWVWHITSHGPQNLSHRQTRGPLVWWTTSRSKQLRDAVNPFSEWKRFQWPFTVDDAWPAAPEGFKREFEHLWRQFDSRPKNRLSGDRADSPFPHELTFLQDRTASEELQMVQVNELSHDYRIFAIPKAVVTKGGADEIGKWLANDLKKGNSLLGHLLKTGLLDAAELFGRDTEWEAFLAHRTRQRSEVARPTQFYRRSKYMDRLVSLIYPNFNLAELLAKPTHRSRKKYTRKGRND